MGTIELPPDLSEFLRLLSSHGVEYLLVGGYAVGLHGYPRTTGDMDVWVNPSAENASKLVNALVDFGYAASHLSPTPFTNPAKIVRLGVPPVCIDLIMSISGADFASSYARRKLDESAGVPVSLISLDDLKANKRAAGRPKDIDDLNYLP
jgi:hypothetical protein